MYVKRGSEIFRVVLSGTMTKISRTATKQTLKLITFNHFHKDILRNIHPVFP